MTKVNNNYISFLLLLIFFLVSVHWYYLDKIWTPVLSVVSIALLYFCSNKQYNIRIFKISFIGILFFYVYKFLRYPGIGVFIEPLILAVVLLMKDGEKKAALRFITLSFSVITLFSIIAWILYLVGIIDVSKVIEYKGYNLGTHVLFFANANIGLEMIPRFQGLLMEPGHLGMIISLLLYANNYKRKDICNIILFIGLVLTLSLAAYSLFIIGIVLHYLSNGGRGSKASLLLFLIIIAYAIMVMLQNTDSVAYNLFLAKVVESDNGFFNANRYGTDFLQYYDKHMSDSFTALFGLGDAFDIERFPGNSGYRVGVISMGWIGVLILFFAYYCIAKPYHNKRCYFFFLLYIISYFQRPYADWLAEWFIFILAMPGLSQLSNNSISSLNNEKVLLSDRKSSCSVIS